MKYDLQIYELTLITLSKPKVFSLCHQYRSQPGQPANPSAQPQPDQALYCLLTNFKCFHLDIPKNDYGQI